MKKKKKSNQIYKKNITIKKIDLKDLLLAKKLHIAELLGILKSGGVKCW